MDWIWLTCAGLGVGVMFGVFGAGGSAFATPVLVLLGVPAPIAIASPLPAMLPASLAGAHQHFRAGFVDRRTAALAVAAGVPAVIAGAALSHVVGGDALLALSGLMLFGVGARMLVPDRPFAANVERGERAETRTALVVTLVGGAAFLSGLLANGGGFLLVPIFILVLGFTAVRAAGTSMVAVAALVVPTLAMHWMLGDIDWSVAGAFALGVIPATMVGARFSHRLPQRVSRRALRHHPRRVRDVVPRHSPHVAEVTTDVESRVVGRSEMFVDDGEGRFGELGLADEQVREPRITTVVHEPRPVETRHVQPGSCGHTDGRGGIPLVLTAVVCVHVDLAGHDRHGLGAG